MLQECVAVFQKILEEQGGGEQKILDEYVPASGTYLLVTRDGTIRFQEEIELKKKKEGLILERGLHFALFCFMDYHSRLISMNKPMDSKKVIHSDNYLSFWIKKDSLVSGKLSPEIIDRYYDTLLDPIGKKYGKSQEAVRIYQEFEEKNGAVDQEELERCRRWIKEHIFSLDCVDFSKKGYLKIFFEADEETYIREDQRYLLPNIYNNNDYNVEINGEILGIPDNNLGMNAKKPFLSIKTRKYPAPYLLNEKQVIQQKQFFDYLTNQAAIGRLNIYIDTDKNKIYSYTSKETCKEKIDSGYFLRLNKGKETEISYQDNLSGYRQEMKYPFYFRNFMDAKYTRHPEYAEWFKRIDSRMEFKDCINDVVFLNYLNGNLWRKEEEVSALNEEMRCDILFARATIRNWSMIRSGEDLDRRLKTVLEKVTLRALKRSVLANQPERTSWQLNFLWSCKEYFRKKEENGMEESGYELVEKFKKKVLTEESPHIEKGNDEEYYFTVGQFVGYLISLNKAKNRPQSLVNPFLNATNDKVLKCRIGQIYKKYNYTISHDSKRAKKLLGMVMSYTPTGAFNMEKFLWGYAESNVMYTKKEETE
ncbi:CRISPR-associated protein [Brotaphodocola sp.]|uniref:CRISPR-associated protein n=1 Tax=Brotaphodocola sp. TaxID=3073577 RepID=UPI003D7CA258